MEKEVIILVYYVNIGTLSGHEVNEFLLKVHDMFENIEWPEDVFVKTFSIPVNDQRSRLECIYPVNMKNNKENRVYAALCDASDRVEEYLNAVNTTDTTDES